MKDGIRTLRPEPNIGMWSKQVEECNSSGLCVAKWCSENNISVSTYRSRQRKVLKLFQRIRRMGFVEVTVQPEVSTTSSNAVTIGTGNFTADIHNGAYEDTITLVKRAIKSD